MVTSLAGSLLVARPGMLDPNFYRSVIYVAEHGDDGALGLVLDRPTESPVDEHLPEWGSFIVEPKVVFVGGPVSNEVAVGLARRPAIVPEGWAPALDDTAIVDLAAGPEAVGRVDALRVFSGYSGWVTGQLELELGTDSWFVVPAAPDDLFTREPATLWRRVLSRQPGRLAFYANYPHDLRSN